jgi:hypothetical protein
LNGRIHCDMVCLAAAAAIQDLIRTFRCAR